MEQESHQNFTDLDVWKKGRELKKEVEGLAKTFPSEEKYRLTDQVTRLVRSIISNIAEGDGRCTYKIKFTFLSRKEAQSVKP